MKGGNKFLFHDIVFKYLDSKVSSSVVNDIPLKFDKVADLY
jgi:hypothetical protein